MTVTSKQTYRSYASVVAIVLFLSACATGYHPYQPFGTGGYTEESISTDMYRVTYYGNHATSMATLDRMLMYRCAELTIEHGFDGFEITNGYSKLPLSTLGGFRTVYFTIHMFRGVPITKIPHTYLAQNILDRFGPEIKKQ